MDQWLCPGDRHREKSRAMSPRVLTAGRATWKPAGSSPHSNAVIQLFFCVPGSAFYFPSQYPKSYAPTQGFMFNILGFKPKFHVPCCKYLPHHLLPLLLPGSLRSARLEVKSPCFWAELMQVHLPPSWPV